jgi:hypothetical protein
MWSNGPQNDYLQDNCNGLFWRRKWAWRHFEKNCSFMTHPMSTFFGKTGPWFLVLFIGKWRFEKSHKKITKCAHAYAQFYREKQPFIFMCRSSEVASALVTAQGWVWSNPRMVWSTQGWSDPSPRKVQKVWTANLPPKWRSKIKMWLIATNWHLYQMDLKSEFRSILTLMTLKVSDLVLLINCCNFK